MSCWRASARVGDEVISRAVKPCLWSTIRATSVIMAGREVR